MLAHKQHTTTEQMAVVVDALYSHFEQYLFTISATHSAHWTSFKKVNLVWKYCVVDFLSIFEFIIVLRASRDMGRIFEHISPVYLITLIK